MKYLFLLLFLTSCSGLVPLHFSEISQIKRDYGTNLDPLTEYYAKLNDYNMKVFEAYNNTILAEGDKKTRLARELEFHVDKEFSSHKNTLTTLRTNLQYLSKQSRDKISNLLIMGQIVNELYLNLEAAWEYSSYDHYVTYTYRCGKSTCVGSRYAGTTHTFTFNPNSAKKAIEAYNKFMSLQDPYFIDLKQAKFSGADNEWAIDRIRNRTGFKGRCTNYMYYINMFSTRNMYVYNKSEIIKDHKIIRMLYPKYMSKVSESRSVSYRTLSHSDSGPRAYQINEETKEVVTQLNNLIFQIEFSLRTKDVKDNYDNVVYYIDMVFKNGKVKGKDRRIIIETAKANQNSAFYETLKYKF